MDRRIQNARKNQPSNIDGRRQAVCQKWKRIGNPNKGDEDIQWRFKDGIWYTKICYSNNEKRKTINDRRNRTIKSRKNQEKTKVTNIWEYWKLKLSNKRRWKKRFFKRIPQENEKTTRNQTTQQKSHQRDKRKILEVVLKVEDGRNGIREQENS